MIKQDRNARILIGGEINGQLEEIEIRLAIEERDKKIIIGFVAIGLPVILTILELFLK
jgi:hypothetical protein